MEDRSTAKKNWYEAGPIIQRDGNFVIKDLLIRWNEQTELNGEGVTEYVYTAHRFDLELPSVVQPGAEAVGVYLEAAKDAIMADAQARALQGAGFDE